MDKVAYLVNSTPKYFYLLPLHFQLIRRYAPTLPFDLFLATEVPEHPICRRVGDEFGVTIIPLKEGEAGFLDSRKAALQWLIGQGEHHYVLPMQEDFLLDRAPDFPALRAAVQLLADSSGEIASVRLMPCPGPLGPILAHNAFATIRPETDNYGFVFQATLWRLDACFAWYEALCAKLEAEWPRATTKPEKRIMIEVRFNFAENLEGQKFFWKFFGGRRQRHVGWRREGPWRNAVYLSPWPYRPTAIVQGKLEAFAAELAEREGFSL
jgi:hypothetical protein